MTKATISYHESDSQSYAAMIAVKSALTTFWSLSICVSLN